MPSSPDYHPLSTMTEGHGLAPLPSRFAILQELENRDKARCFLARDRAGKFNDTVVLKVLWVTEADAPSELLSFLLESHAAAQLSHQNIALSSRPELAEGVHFYVSEYPRNAETLRSLLDRVGWLEIDRALTIAAQIADALRHAHEAGVLHLALQPENVWVDREGRVTLTGFGIAKMPGREWAHRKRSRDSRPAYRSPEQLADGSLDERSDLYTLGVILYEMLTDLLPFHAPDENRLQQKILTHKAPPVCLIRPDIPALVSDVVEKLISKDPATRVYSAASLGEKLRRLLSAQPRMIEAQPDTACEPADPDFQCQAIASSHPDGGRKETVIVRPVEQKEAESRKEQALRIATHRQELMSLPPASSSRIVTSATPGNWISRAAEPFGRLSPWRYALVVCGLALSTGISAAMHTGMAALISRELGNLFSRSTVSKAALVSEPVSQVSPDSAPAEAEARETPLPSAPPTADSAAPSPNTAQLRADNVAQATKAKKRVGKAKPIRLRPRSRMLRRRYR